MEVAALDAFSQWYRSEHPRVLGSLTALSGSLDHAAEATDEAFARALSAWDRVSQLEAPAGSSGDPLVPYPTAAPVPP